MKKYTLRLFLVIILGFCKTAYAQNIKFNRVIPEDGTNFIYVNDITQDKDGFMWFATNKGLYNYDGNLLTHFKNDSLNSNSISSTSIKTIYADSNGVFWIGSSSTGLDRYDSETGVFTHFRHNPNDANSIADDKIFDILKDHKGKLWIATNSGLDQFDPKTNGFIHFKPEKDNPTTLSDLRVRCLYEDKSGTLWIGTGNRWLSTQDHEPEYGGLNRYNRESGTFTQYRSKANDPHALISNKVTSIFEDNKGVFWITTHDNGLHQMDKEKGTFKQKMYDPVHPEIFGNLKNTDRRESINFISQDTTGGYWLGKHFTGLHYFDPRVGKMFNYYGDGTGTGGFDAATVAYTSQDGVLWIGSSREGNVYRVNILHQKIPKPFVSAVSVNALYEEQDGTFWIGKRNDLIRVDKKNGDIVKYNTALKFTQDSGNRIYDIVKDLQGTIWVGASTGLFKYDSANDTFKGYQQDSKNENSLSNKRVNKIFEDSQHNFWVGTHSGLYQMDRNSEQFTEHNEFLENYVSTIFEDTSGYVWIGGWIKGRGLKRYNPDTKTFKTYLSGTTTTIVYQDSDGVYGQEDQMDFITTIPVRMNLFLYVILMPLLDYVIFIQW